MKPKTEITNRQYKHEINNFFEVVRDTSFDISKLEKLLSDLLTESEMKMLRHRWYVANLINRGRTVRETAEIARVGTDTVMRVVKKIRGGSGVLKEILINKLKSEPDSKDTPLYKKEKKQKTIKWFFGVK